ncbi:MAG: NADH-quinone oxidoreductase subunit N [Verrucomicrobia bacterium]|nr:MAG: NADH-quinone oxidoreductase subunit N [Verrucomicrobiota bacterium]
MNYLELLKLAAPEALLALTALVVLALGLATTRGPGICSAVAAAGILCASAAILLLPEQATLFRGMLVISPLTSLFKIICLALAFFTVILARGSCTPRHRGEYLALLLLATIGLLLLVGSEELLMIFIGLELTGLSLYVMAGFDKTDQRSAEAGLKYFLFGSTASAFTLFGLSLVYGMCGTTGLGAIGEKVAAGPVAPLMTAGIVMTLIGFAFKIAAAPFHLWAPDAYQGAPVPSAAFIASGSKVASFVVLGKIVLIAFGPAHGSAAWHAMVAGWAPVLAVLAALSIVIGNLVALAQSNVRRLLAYSAVAHAGYTLLGLVAGGRDGFGATLFYTTTYAFTLVGAFAVVAMVRHETGGDEIKNFAGLSSRSPLLSGCMAIFMLSLAGLPPLAGFFGKFYLFSTALRAGGNHGLLWLVVLALLGSFISLYYYLTVLKAVFVDDPEPGILKLATGRVRPIGGPETSSLISLDFLQRISLISLAAVVLVLGLLPGSFVSQIAAALSSLP